METFSIEKYTPIDYRTWVLGNPARAGVNIKRLNVLDEKELILWNYAVQYQDCRNDAGHGEASTFFAIRLLDYLPGVREVVVPSIIFHDTGFYGVDPNEWKRLVEEAKAKGDLKSLDDEAKRRPHQNRGIAIATRSFERFGYPTEKYQFEIADIIGDHDTRKLPTTDSGRIMRIADLLWRTTYPHAQIYMANENPEEVLKEIEKTLIGEREHLGEVGVAVGRLECTNTVHRKFGEGEARRVLLPKYLPELERIAAFYKS